MAMLEIHFKFTTVCDASREFAQSIIGEPVETTEPRLCQGDIAIDRIVTVISNLPFRMSTNIPEPKNRSKL